MSRGEPEPASSEGSRVGGEGVAVTGSPDGGVGDVDVEEGQETPPPVAAKVPGGGCGGTPWGAQPLRGDRAHMPRGACQGSELHGGGGRWGPRQRAAQGSPATLAPRSPPSHRVWPRWLLCSWGTQRRPAASSPTWPALASVPGPARPAPVSICQQVSTSCPAVLREFGFHGQSKGVVVVQATFSSPSGFTDCTGEGRQT